MSDDKLAVIILDALDTYNIRQLNLSKIEELMYERNSEILGVSTLPHTAQSNPMIWGGFHNTNKYWVKEPGQKWTDPSTGFSRKKGESKAQAERVWERHDFKESFIWDVLQAQNVEASAVHIPIVLPPYNFNTVDSYDMGDAWFPKDEKQMKAHVREAPDQVVQHVEEGREFIATSIQMPDKWLHGMPEGQCSDEFVRKEAQELDKRINNLVDELESNDYDWIIIGDHGSPWPGAMKSYEVKQLLPRHRKESVIISNLDDVPTYTGEIYDFLLDYFDAEDMDYRDLGKSYISQYE